MAREEQPRAGAPRPLQKVLRGIAVGAAAAALLCIAAEGLARLLRLAAPGDAAVGAEPDAWMEYSADLGWGLRPGFFGRLFSGERRIDAGGLQACDTSKLLRRKGRLAIVLGDSCTFGNGVATDETYPEVLSRRLRGWDVLNLGVPGHSSFQGLRALERAAPRLRPDAVIFAYGFNDRRYVLRPEEADSAARFARLARAAWWAGIARRSALLGWLRARGAGGDAMAGGLVSEPLDVRLLRARVDPREYQRNLEAAARLCRERGVRLMVLVLADHPEKSLPLRRGMRALERGSRAEAERHLRSAVELANEFSDAARYSLSALLADSGRGVEAARVGVSPRTMRSPAGGYPLYDDLRYHDVAVAVGARLGARVLDARPLLDAHPEWFFDFIHFNAEAHRALADLLEPELSGMIPADERAAPDQR